MDDGFYILIEILGIIVLLIDITRVLSHWHICTEFKKFYNKLMNNCSPSNSEVMLINETKD